MRGRIAILVAAAFIATAAWPSGALAEPLCTTNWVGDGSNNAWSDAVNWDVGRLPTDEDVVCVSGDADSPHIDVSAPAMVAEIHSSRPIRITSSMEIAAAEGQSSVSSIALAGGLLKTASDLTILPGASLAMNNGTLSGSGSVTIDDGASATVAGSSNNICESVTLENHGNLRFMDQTILSVCNTPGKTPSIINDGTLSINGQLNVNDNYDPGVSGEIRNTGTITKTGAATATFYWPIDNDGIIESTQGLLTMNGGGIAQTVSDGSFAGPMSGVVRFYQKPMALAGGNSLFSGNVEVMAPLTVEGDATLSGSTRVYGWAPDLGVTSAGITAAGRVTTSGALSVEVYGYLSGGGQYEILPGASLAMNNGTLSGSGSVTIDDGASATVAGSSNNICESVTLENHGNLTFMDQTILSVCNTPGKTPSIINDGTLSINGQLNVNDNYDPGVSGEIRNTGTITKTGAATATFYWPIDNDGIIESTQGLLTMNGGGIAQTVSDGSFAGPMSGVVRIHRKAMALAGGNSLFSGNVEVMAPLTVEGDATLSGSTRVYGWAPDLGVTSAGITAAGRVTTSGALSVEVYGYLSGGGQYEILPGASLALKNGASLGGSGNTIVQPLSTLSISGTLSIGGSRQLINRGDATMDSSSSVSATGDPPRNPRIRNSGRWSIDGGWGISYMKMNGADFVNTGTLVKTSNTQTKIDWPVVNDGIIEVREGDLRLASLESTADAIVHTAIRGSVPGADYGVLSTAGGAWLHGLLEVTTDSAYQPVAGTVFTPVTYPGGRYGAFRSVSGIDGVDGPPYEAQYAASALQLIARGTEGAGQGVAPAAAEGLRALLVARGQVRSGPTGLPTARTGAIGADEDATVASASLVPRLALSTTVDRITALPGDSISYNVRLTNEGANLRLSGSLTSAPIAHDSEVKSYLAFLERRDAATGEWHSVAGTSSSSPGYTPEFLPAAQSGLTLDATPISATGVTYPSPGGDRLLGTTVMADAAGAWGFDANVELTPRKATELTDRAKTSGFRMVYRIELNYVTDDCPQGVPAGETVRASFALLQPNATATDASITVTDPAGGIENFTKTEIPQLASIAPGEAVGTSVNYDVAVIESKGGEETDSEYLARLQAAVGSPLTVIAGAQAMVPATDPPDGESALVPLVLPTSSATSTEKVPVLTVDKTGPASVMAGEQAVYDIALHNIGTAAATPTVSDRDSGGGPIAVTALPEVLDSDETAVAQSVVDAPTVGTASISDTASVVWADSAGNAYGPVSDDATTTVVPQNSGTPDAPAIDDGRPSPSFSSQTDFLFTGEDAIQQGVEPEAIEPQRQAVIRGRVKDVDGQPLGGVSITVLDHPEYGATASRSDGEIYVAVNGGAPLSLVFRKPGYLPSERRVTPDWRDYAWLTEDVALVRLDERVTQVVLGGDQNNLQMAQGDVVGDADGTRQSTLFFQPGTQAWAQFNDGHEVPLTDASVRATELTVGPNGPAAMPAELPPTIAYTYAAAFTSDEAMRMGAEHVRFSKPVINYVENFLNFPVGQPVPTGYQDMKLNVWVPEKSGVIVKILGIADGLAQLDVEGADEVATQAQLDEMGVTGDELRKLAAEYPVGAELWRVPITHFSNHLISMANGGGPSPAEVSGSSNSYWDHNQGMGLPGDAEGPPGAGMNAGGCDAGRVHNSVVYCESQRLTESIELPGVPYSLNYSSDRVTGAAASRSVEIPLSRDRVPASLKRIDLILTILGREFVESFEPEPKQSHRFVWDGEDRFGRRVTGTHTLSVKVGYVYDGLYGSTPTFGSPVTQSGLSTYNGAPFFVSGSRTRQELTVWQRYTKQLSAYDARRQGLGGWSLAETNYYDPTQGVLYRGDGESSEVAPLKFDMLFGIAGNIYPGYSGDGGAANLALMRAPSGLTYAGDGTMYVADTKNNRVRKIVGNGTISTIAGSGEYGMSGDGALAAEGALAHPSAVATDAAGGLYIADTNNNRIRRVDNSGVITTIAGGGTATTMLGDGGPATSARLSQPRGIAVAPWGDVFIADTNNDSIRRIAPDGRISTYAGVHEPGFTGDGGRANLAKLNSPQGIALDSSGNLFVADTGNNRIRKIRPTGEIETIAGGGAPDELNDALPATRSGLEAPRAVAVAPNGTVFVTDTAHQRVRSISPEGTIATLAGGGSGGETAAGAALKIPAGIAISPAGDIVIADAGQNRLMGVRIPGVQISVSDLLIPSPDGRHVYRFSAEGIHLATLDAMTGAPILGFEYDAKHRLTSIVDTDGNSTSIEHDQDGSPTAIVGPYGQRTELAVNDDGYLESVTLPGGATYVPTYEAGGLLSSFGTPRGGQMTATYDALGRLTHDRDRAGNDLSLTRSGRDSDKTVDVTTDLGRTTRYRVRRHPAGQDRMITDPAGLTRTSEATMDGVTKSEWPDGTKTSATSGADPRFGLLAPFTAKSVLITPDGLTRTLTQQRSANVEHSGDIFSLLGQTSTRAVNGKTSTTTFQRQGGGVGSSATITSSSPAGRTTTATVDARSRPKTLTIPGLAPLSYGRDARGRLDEVSTGTRTTQLSYDDNGNINSVTDPLGATTQMEYDAAGNLTSQVLPGGSQVAFTYDAEHNLTSVTPPTRPAHTFTYSLVSLVTSGAAPQLAAEPSTTRYEYSSDRELTKIIRPSGRSATFEYGITSGRLKRIRSDDGDTTYSYDATSGDVKAATSPSGVTQTLQMDGQLPTSVHYTGPVSADVDVDYNNDFLPKKLTIAGSSHNLTYDADQLLTGAGALSLAYSATNGLPTQTTLGAVTTSTTFNQYAEPAQRTASFPGGSYAESYERDNAGRITTRTEQGPSGTTTWSYAYDPSGRLASVVKDGDPHAAYTYDANGNRTSLTTGSGPARTATFDIRDRMTTQADKSFSYDPDGNLTAIIDRASGTQTTFAYAATGNLTSATTDSGKAIKYLLDAAGNRVAKQVGGQLQQGFLYAPGIQGPVAELDATGAVTTRFIYANNPLAPEYIVKNGASYRIIKDQLGSPRLVVDSATGEVAQAITYDPFGNILSDSNPGFQPFGFAGGLYDSDTGLTHFGAREYSAKLGRWTSSDPISFAGGDANLYGYVLDDPVNLVDPGGTFSVRASLNSYTDFVNGSSHLSYLSNYAAGVLNGMFLNVPNLIAGVSGECAGSGYGLGNNLGVIGSLALGVGQLLAGYRTMSKANESVGMVRSLAPSRVSEMNGHLDAARSALRTAAMKDAGIETVGMLVGRYNSAVYCC